MTILNPLSRINISTYVTIGIVSHEYKVKHSTQPPMSAMLAKENSIRNSKLSYNH